MPNMPGKDDPSRRLPIGAPGASNDRRQIWRIAPAPVELAERPLDFLLAEHHRQREAAAILIRIADGAFDPEGIGRLIDFLKGDFARHVGDEELVFFPILRAACALDDEIDVLTARLSEEHAADESLGEEVLELLAKRRAGSALAPADCARIRHFAEHLRQHLALENAVLLPIAEARLSENDRAALAAALSRRRAK